jgi:hypothetical protein
VRPSAIVPERPAFSPVVKRYASVAAEQLWKCRFAVPTGRVVTACGSSKTPPVVA